MAPQCLSTLAPLVFAQSRHRLRFEVHIYRLGKPQTDINDRRNVDEFVASAVSTERAAYGKATAVEVVQNEDVFDMRRQFIEQLSRRRYTHPFRAHERDVETLL